MLQDLMVSGADFPRESMNLTTCGYVEGDHKLNRRRVAHARYFRLPCFPTAPRRGRSAIETPLTSTQTSILQRNGLSKITKCRKHRPTMCVLLTPKACTESTAARR